MVLNPHRVRPRCAAPPLYVIEAGTACTATGPHRANRSLYYSVTSPSRPARVKSAQCRWKLAFSRIDQCCLCGCCDGRDAEVVVCAHPALEHRVEQLQRLLPQRGVPHLPRPGAEPLIASPCIVDQQSSRPPCPADAQSAGPATSGPSRKPASQHAPGRGPRLTPRPAPVTPRHPPAITGIPVTVTAGPCTPGHRRHATRGRLSGNQTGMVSADSQYKMG
jgi:hypothetical protein